VTSRKKGELHEYFAYVKNGVLGVEKKQIKTKEHKKNKEFLDKRRKGPS
jgi:hypothetical protein